MCGIRFDCAGHLFHFLEDAVIDKFPIKDQLFKMCLSQDVVDFFQKAAKENLEMDVAIIGHFKNKEYIMLMAESFDEEAILKNQKILDEQLKKA